jgi:membrane protease YdiL (CAAX protease family)
MTEPDTPAIAAEDTEQPAPRRRFSLLITIACSIVVAVYIGLPLGPLLQQSGSPLDQLDRPEDSLERLVTRELDLRDAMRRGASWEWRLYRFLSGGDDPISEAQTWYEELTDAADSLSAELHLAILRAESGQSDPADQAVTHWKSWGESGERIGDWVAAAYLDPPPDPESGRAVITDIRDESAPDWFTDTLAARIATRIGDAKAGSDAQAAIFARGRVLQRRLRLLTACVVVLLAVGTLFLVKGLVRPRALRVADAPVPPDWSFGDGYALFVRALGAPQAIVLVTFFLLHRQTPWETPLAMAADLPIAWWVVSYLRSRDAPLAATFGLAPPRRTWARLAGVTVVLIAVAFVADTLVDTGGGLIGLKSHWADGFSEDILWHPRWPFVLDCVNVTVWAPMVEELTFRGLLYATLRTRLAVVPSAFLSAVLFALPHGYAAAGSISVLVSGLLWAWAYERTRSLLPGLLAHAANNLMSIVWVVGLLRW